jgi:hypothetical protein
MNPAFTIGASGIAARIALEKFPKWCANWPYQAALAYSHVMVNRFLNGSAWKIESAMSTAITRSIELVSTTLRKCPANIKETLWAFHVLARK